MARKTTIAAREKFVLRLAKIIFGGGYDDNIGLAQSMARDERVWPKVKPKKAPSARRRSATTGERE